MEEAKEGDRADGRIRAAIKEDRDHQGREEVEGEGGSIAREEEEGRGTIKEEDRDLSGSLEELKCSGRLSGCRNTGHRMIVMIMALPMMAMMLMLIGDIFTGKDQERVYNIYRPPRLSLLLNFLCKSYRFRNRMISTNQSPRIERIDAVPPIRSDRSLLCSDLGATICPEETTKTSWYR